MSAGIYWSGTTIEDMISAVENYSQDVLDAIEEVALYLAPILEGHAKLTAPWQDRTGNARQSLFAVVDVARDIVTLYLSHGMEYGLWLEVRYAGRYAVILPTLQAHYSMIDDMLQDIFEG